MSDKDDSFKDSQAPTAPQGAPDAENARESVGNSEMADATPPAEPGDAARESPPARTGDLAAPAVPTPGPEDRMAALETEKAELKDRMLRIAAEFDNFKKRARKETADHEGKAREHVLRDFLEIADNLERAVISFTLGGEKDAKSVRDGVDLVLRQFRSKLERYAVKPIEAKGQPFDPRVHDAISQVPSAEVPAGTVLQELQKGYHIGERLLRPAMVVVAAAPPPPREPEAAKPAPAAPVAAAEEQKKEQKGESGAKPEGGAAEGAKPGGGAAEGAKPEGGAAEGAKPEGGAAEGAKPEGGAKARDASTAPAEGEGAPNGTAGERKPA